MSRSRVTTSSSSDEIVSIASSISSSNEECDNFDDIMKNGNLASSKKTQQNSQYTHFLGFKFLTKNLQERNKNPFVVLWSISTAFLVYCSLSFFTYIVSTNFNLVFCISQPILVATHLLLTYNNLKMSLAELQNPSTYNKILLGIIQILTPLQDLYGFIKLTPFQSQSLFLLSFFFICLCLAFYIYVVVTKNEASWDEKNYQLVYFVNCCMFAFINTIAVVDVISDIVLGIDNILKLRLIYLLFGIFLVLFGVIDLAVLGSRLAYPNRYTLKRQILTIFLELLILGVSIADIFVDRYFKKLNSDSANDIFQVGLISISSTLVYLIHHVTLIIIQKMNLNEDKAIRIVQVKR